MATAALAALVTATGCASVPTSSDVHEGEPLDSALGQDAFVRVLADPPAPGASPEEVVDGFLDASASFESGHAVARQYLAPAVRNTWSPLARVVVYDPGTEERSIVSSPESVVTVTAPLEATIDAQGGYRPAAPGATTRARFHLQEIAGEWRIDELPVGLYLSSQDLARTFQSLNLFFPDPGLSILVPDPVFLPIRPDGVASVLVEALLRRPSSWLRPAVSTGFPSGTTLRSPVRMEGGGAVRVDLSSQALTATPEQARALSAQLVWALRQVPRVTGVRITVEGAPYEVPDAGRVQPLDAWPGFDPDGLAEGGESAYFIRRERLFELPPGGPPSRVPGVVGADGPAIAAPAVSLDGARVAALTEDRDAVLLGDVGGGPLGVALEGDTFTAPSWDRTGACWIVQRTAKGAVVWVLRPGEDAQRVQAEAIPRDVRALRIARDGTRAALVAVVGESTRLLLARVVRSGEQPQLEAPKPVTLQLSSLADVAWADADRLAVIGGRDIEAAPAPQVYLIDVDGSALDARGAAASGMVTVAAAPGSPTTIRPLLVGAVGDRLYQNSGATTWRALGRGSSPVYPG